MKRLLAFVLLLVLALSSVACTNTPAPAVGDDSKEPAANSEQGAEIADVEVGDAEAATDELVIWISYGDGSPVASIYQAAVEEYKLLYPNVNVKLNCMGGDISTALETVLQNPSSPDFPDIFDGGDAHLEAFAKEGLLYDLSEAMQTGSYDDPNITWESTFMPSLISSQKYDGKTVMVPTCYYSCGFFYDENMFKELAVSVPTTWEEFKALNKILAEKGIALIACDGALDMYNYWLYVVMAERYVDASEMREIALGNGSFKDDPGYLKAAQIVADMYAEGMYQDGFEGSVYPACQAIFAQGKAATHFCGGWLPSEMSSITPDTMALRVFPLPALPDEKYPGVTEAWGNANAITADAKNKVNAINFLKLFSSKKYGNMYVENNIDSSLNNMPMVDKTAGYAEFVANAPTLVPNSNGLSHLGEWTVNVLGPLSTQLVTGKLSPEKFIDQLDSQTNAYYNK